LRIGTIAAGGEDDAPACSDRFARTHYDAGHSAVFDRKASDVLIGEHRHAAGTQHLEEMADQAQPLDAHVLPSALTDEVLVPARKAVDAAPGDLLFGDHETGHVIGRWEACAPVVEIALRDQVDLKRLPDRVGAWRLAVITVGQAADDAKTDDASFKKFQRLRRTVDERAHSVVVEAATAEKPHIGDDLVPRVAVAGGLREMFLAHPDQSVGIDRAAAQGARLFEDDRPQAQFVGSERPARPAMPDPRMTTSQVSLEITESTSVYSTEAAEPAPAFVSPPAG